MQQLRISKYVAAMVLALGVAGVAQAQSGLPPAHQQGAVSFVSGGVGQDESTAFERNEGHWPLALRFTGAGGEFLADVHVSVSDAKGTEVLKTDARGPFMLVKLAPGRYTVRATYNGKPQSREIRVPGTGSVKEAFSWAAQ